MSILTVTLHPALDRVLRGDRLRPNGTMRTKIEMEYCGGKGNNVARALVRLGQSATAIGFQGGYTGDFATQQLASEGVTTAFINCQKPTRISNLLHEDETGYTYAIYEPGQTVTADEIDCLRKRFEDLVRAHDLILFCGSAQTKLLAPVFGELIQQANHYGIPTLLDSSGEALKLGVIAKPYLVKVNNHELTELFDIPLNNLEDQIKALNELCEKGIQIAAMTLGEKGMIATDGSQVLRGLLPLKKVINTVGCGDSTLAGVAYAILNHPSLPEIIRWGVACGAANTQTSGAGFITMSIVESYLSKVSIVSLD
ncbi:MAG TPA: 1-phosphofructokinase family hexose kinase [Anaerolineae bacterium]|nr:1-phosphofructokinase family hexose kinase [Anaerolineae bacterium]